LATGPRASGWANCNALGGQAKDITGVLGMIGEENFDPKKHGVWNKSMPQGDLPSALHKIKPHAVKIHGDHHNPPNSCSSEDAAKNRAGNAAASPDADKQQYADKIDEWEQENDIPEEGDRKAVSGVQDEGRHHVEGAHASSAAHAELSHGEGVALELEGASASAGGAGGDRSGEGPSASMPASLPTWDGRTPGAEGLSASHSSASNTKPPLPLQLDLVRVGKQAIESGMVPLCCDTTWAKKRQAGAAALAMLQSVIPDYPADICGSLVSGLVMERSHVDVVLCLKGHPMADSGHPVEAFMGHLLRYVNPMKPLRSKKGKPAEKSAATVLCRFGFKLVAPAKIHGSRLLSLVHTKNDVTVKIWCDPNDTCGWVSQPLATLRAKAANHLVHSSGLLFSLLRVWRRLEGKDFSFVKTSRQQWDWQESGGGVVQNGWIYSTLLLIENYLRAMHCLRQGREQEDTEAMVGEAFMGLLDYLSSLPVQGSLVILSEPAGMVPRYTPLVTLDYRPCASCLTVDPLGNVPVTLRLVPAKAQLAAAAIRHSSTSLEELLTEGSPARRAFVTNVLSKVVRNDSSPTAPEHSRTGVISSGSSSQSQ
jgi:hypothetical protein